MRDGYDLQREIQFTTELEAWARAELYGVRQGAWRVEAAMAVAAAAAEETYRLTDAFPDWQNETSILWRANLARVWEYLDGDRSQHYALSRAIAEFLVSPLNHNEGEDGPDDFNLPQTMASYSAALSVVVGGVDLAMSAVRQIFEAIDHRYEAGYGEVQHRWAEVQHEAEFVRSVVAAVVGAKRAPGSGFSPELLSMIKR